MLSNIISSYYKYLCFNLNDDSDTEITGRESILALVYNINHKINSFYLKNCLVFRARILSNRDGYRTLNY